MLLSFLRLIAAWLRWCIGRVSTASRQGNDGPVAARMLVERDDVGRGADGHAIIVIGPTTATEWSCGV